jgi:hypothetical protein
MLVRHFTKKNELKKTPIFIEIYISNKQVV